MKPLSCFAQEFYHSPAFIVGTKEALLSLKETIDAALNDNASSATFYDADGEGYKLIVIQVAEEKFEQLTLPYSDEIAKTNYGISPYDLIVDRKHLLK